MNKEKKIEIRAKLETIKEKVENKIKSLKKILQKIRVQ